MDDPIHQLSGISWEVDFVSALFLSTFKCCELILVSRNQYPLSAAKQNMFSHSIRHHLFISSSPIPSSISFSNNPHPIPFAGLFIINIFSSSVSLCFIIIIIIIFFFMFGIMVAHMCGERKKELKFLYFFIIYFLISLFLFLAFVFCNVELSSLKNCSVIWFMGENKLEKTWENSLENFYSDWIDHLNFTLKFWD